jgi:histidine ammonia-lyase
MCAVQGLEYRKPLRPSREIERAHAAVRAVIPRLDQDRTLAPDIEALAKAIRLGHFDAWRD